MVELPSLYFYWLVAATGIAFVALIVGYVLQRSQQAQQLMREQQLQNDNQRLSLEAENVSDLQLALQQSQHKVIALEQQVVSLQALANERQALNQQIQQMQQQTADMQMRYESQIATLTANEKGAAEKIELLQQAEQRLQHQFENVANRIFEQKSESFAKANKTGLDGLLGPLKEQIEGFKRQVSDAYIKEGQERASLKTEILSLKELNQRITTEAAALTNALKGDNKQQGNWGEMVLERILEQSGLREGYEFDTQTSLRSEEGKQLQPDVIVHLPNEKDVIIDSKVSLTAYDGYHNSEDKDQQTEFLKQHVQSLRAHIKGLGKKDYQKLKGVRTLDYVLMFIPIEPAFLLAVDHDPEIVSFALSNNIMLVSPTNLLVALRTINNIWQYEYQNQNAQAIAERAAKLYDKFSGFVTDMEKLEKSMDTSQKTFAAAFNKLSTGKGNLIRQVEQFKTMGVQPTKQLPKHLVEDDNESLD